MQKILIIAFVLNSALSSFASENQTRDPKGLYSKLVTLYQSSNQPYPMEESVVHSLNDPATFKGCAYSNGKEMFTWEDSSIVTYSITKVPSAGPLSPGEVAVGTYLQSNWFWTKILNYGGRFEDGKLDLDGVDFVGDQVSDCDPSLSPKESWIYTSSGLSADKTSYENRNLCKNGRVYSSENYKLASGYLVGKNTYGQYFYCWK